MKKLLAELVNLKKEDSKTLVTQGLLSKPTIFGGFAECWREFGYGLNFTFKDSDGSAHRVVTAKGIPASYLYRTV